MTGTIVYCSRMEFLVTDMVLLESSSSVGKLCSTLELQSWVCRACMELQEWVGYKLDCSGSPKDSFE